MDKPEIPYFNLFRNILLIVLWPVLFVVVKVNPTPFWLLWAYAALTVIFLLYSLYFSIKRKDKKFAFYILSGVALFAFTIWLIISTLINMPIEPQ